MKKPKDTGPKRAFKSIKQIIAVESIEPIDLSDFVIDSFPYGDNTIKFRTPLILAPFLNESKQLMCLENDTLGINVFAFTREQLLEELQEQLSALWFEYAIAEDEKLTPKALQLKRNLHDAIEESR